MIQSNHIYIVNKLHRLFKILSKTYRYSKFAKYIEVGTILTVIFNVLGIDKAIDIFKVNRRSKNITKIFDLLDNPNTPIFRRTVYKIQNNNKLIISMMFTFLKEDEVAIRLCNVFNLTVNDINIIRKNRDIILNDISNDLMILLSKKKFIKSKDIIDIFRFRLYLILFSIYQRKNINNLN